MLWMLDISVIVYAEHVAYIQQVPPFVMSNVGI